ncbi:MAG: TIGR01212 family radical SAM protein [Clostridia bacterium]|nr:TIGR01212 family radical SAM protein [Clostridia bacterium]
MLYNNLSGYLRAKYGKRMKKICIDGGFCCPNRDGKCGTVGCIYCGERGAGEHIDPTLSIGEQVRAALSAATADTLFIAYFQNFTNTYAPIQVLRERYDAALIDPRIRILSVGTRPDCIDEEVCALLAEYSKTREVWVELGLQTSSDLTADRINRGYHLDTFERAWGLLKKYSLKTVIHLIIGLPGEGDEESRASAEYVAALSPFGVKLHSIYVMRDTALAEMYRQNLYTPPTLDEYASRAAYALSVMPESVVIHRLTGDCPEGELVAPEWNKDKNKIIAHVNATLEGEGHRQGSRAKK